MPLEHASVSIPAGVVMPLLRWLLPPRIAANFTRERAAERRRAYLMGDHGLGLARLISSKEIAQMRDDGDYHVRALSAITVIITTYFIVAVLS